jgi:hypothetical protein
MIRLFEKLEEHRERTIDKNKFKAAKKKTKFAATMLFCEFLKRKQHNATSNFTL